LRKVKGKNIIIKSLASVLQSKTLLSLRLKNMGHQNRKLTMLEREILFDQTESLMARGEQRTTNIAKELNISFDSAKKYMRVVHKRWNKSAQNDPFKVRSEIIEKLKELEKEAWKTYANCTNDSAKVGCFNTILSIVEKRIYLSGLNEIFREK